MSKYQNLLAMLIHMSQMQTPELFQATLAAYIDILDGIPDCYHQDALMGAVNHILGGEEDAE